MDMFDVGGSSGHNNLLPFRTSPKIEGTPAYGKKLNRIEFRTLPLKRSLSSTRVSRHKDEVKTLPKLNALSTQHSARQMMDGLEIKLLRLKELSLRLDYYVQELEDWHSLERKD